MDQINQQIALSQYQVESAQTIFNLATTKAGLETQVLQLQFQQIDQQTASTASLENLVNLIRSTPASQLQTMPQLLGALGLPYQGPTAAQVGPQVGPLTSTPPVYKNNPAYPNYPVYPTNPSPPPWVYGSSTTGIVQGGGTAPITTFTNPSGSPNPNYPLYPNTPGTLPTAPGLPGQLPVTNEPITFNSPGSLQAIAQSPSQQTTNTELPAYYVQDPNSTTAIPVYTSPTTFDTGPNTPGVTSPNTPTSIVGSNVITPSNIATSGMGQVTPGLSAPLADIFQYPGMSKTTGMQIPLPGSELAATQGAAGGFTPGSPSVPITATIPGMLPDIAEPFTDSSTSPDKAGYSGWGLMFFSKANQAVQQLNAGQITSTAALTTLNNILTDLKGTGANTAQLGSVTATINAINEKYKQGIITPGSTAGLSTLAPTTLPGGMTLYGTDSQGNPVYVNPNGSLYTAAGQLIGTVQPSGSPTIPISGAPGTLTTTAPVATMLPGSGPSSGPLGPVIREGSFNPKTLWPQLFQGAPNAAKMATEATISNATNTRIAAEMKLLAAKKSQTDYDMQHVQALNDVMTAIRNGNFSSVSSAIGTLSAKTTVSTRAGAKGTTSIESNLYDLYSERGRYGEGSFAGEYP